MDLWGSEHRQAQRRPPKIAPAAFRREAQEVSGTTVSRGRGSNGEGRAQPAWGPRGCSCPGRPALGPESGVPRGYLCTEAAAVAVNRGPRLPLP